MVTEYEKREKNILHATEEQCLNWEWFKRHINQIKIPVVVKQQRSGITSARIKKYLEKIGTRGPFGLAGCCAQEAPFFEQFSVGKLNFIPRMPTFLSPIFIFYSIS